VGERTTYVELDVHTAMITVALRRPGTRKLITWDVPLAPEAVRWFTRKLPRTAGEPEKCVIA